jgi:putative endonuclease
MKHVAFTQTVDDRRASLRRGQLAEWVAAALLMLKGYRILGRQCRTRAGEIDLIAVRGSVVVFVEVKHRRTLDGAMSAISHNQSQRLRRAADLWLAKRPRYQALGCRFDAVFVSRGGWPVHFPSGA